MEKKYVYTVDNGALSDAQRNFYEENGYIVIKKLVPDEYLDRCYERFVQVSNGDKGNVRSILRISELKKHPGLKGEYTINKIRDLMDDPTFFNNYISNENIIKVVRSIIGPNITAVNSMLINKPPNASYKFSKHPLHQDQHYFPFGPSNKIVASWTAMEEVTEENGCLFVVPGSHKSKLYAHIYPMNVNKQLFHGVKGFDQAPRVNVLMERGDTVFFHPLLLHGSCPNVTNGFRKAISVHYADSNCNFIDVKGTVQEGIEREIMEVLRSQGKSFTNFAHFIKSNAKMISGKPGNFQNLSSQL